MHNRCPTSIVLALTIICSYWTGSPVLSGDSPAGLEWLSDQANETDSPHRVIVFLENEELRRQVSRISTGAPLSRAARIKSVSRRLKSFVTPSARTVESFLTSHSSLPIVRYWIVPAYSAALDESQIRILAALPGVKRIVPDGQISFVEPVETRSASPSAASSSVHARMMNVPDLWQMGITGTGRLVCSFDTGVEQTHPALSGNWRGNRAPLSASWFSTVTPNSPPTDKADHGTHTMGTMCGVAGSDTIGVAPGAEWITAGVIDQGKSLQGTFSDILAAYQWALDPDGDPETTDDVPDVILNSWGVPATLFSPCDNTFFAAIDNIEAAGIVCIFAAGNEGPDARTLRNPASRASSPLNSFAVGAVDNARAIASFSSRGPGGCSMNEVKPEIVAPGVSIRSAAKGGGYKLMSGSSMAAPFIAGLVALCRQYNPNATVEEIKWAIINSATDLGPQGEDNAYGYGLPDASLMLNYLSDPELPHFRLAGYAISGDGVASPGETFELRITLVKTSGSIESVVGRIMAEDMAGVSIIIDRTDFNFGSSGTTSLGTQAYQLRFDPALVNGQEAALILAVDDGTGQVFDSLHFSVPIGVAPNGNQATHSDGTLEFTVSDFGQYGLAPGSIYNVGGRGLRYHDSDNLLYEAGLLIGRNELQLSSSIRGSDGAFVPSDFVPEEPLSDIWFGPQMEASRTARLTDDYSDISIPVAIGQITSDYAPAGDDGIILFRYQLVNTALTTVSGLYFGFFSDFDLPGNIETVGRDNSLDLIYQTGDSGPVVGLVALAGLSSSKAILNGANKTGFDRAEQFALISSESAITGSLSGDILTIISGGPFAIVPGDSVEVAFALVAGDNMEELFMRAARARELYLAPTNVDFPPDGLPAAYNLHQNYPNPFNPSTTIAFELPTAGEVSLQVFNLLGQEVRRLQSGWMAAGRHEVLWNARSSDGREVASGVYFYRLVADGFARTRKMVLLR